MDFDECWIPELIPCSNLAEWENYENSLYKIFIEDWVDSQPHFQQKPVCSGVLTWKALSGNKRCRYKFFHEEERYLVVLEERENYFLLITAYFVENEWSFKSILREYNKSSKT